MTKHTGIEWTDRTWNPVTGCTKISPGCANCYAEALTKRFPSNFPNGFDLTLHPDRLDMPKKWRSPAKVFVCSMGDLFHKDVPLDFVRRVFQVMRETPHHTYQILTKRAQRMFLLSKDLEWRENMWAGVSVESQAQVTRVDYLRAVPAYTRFLSCEPLLTPLELNLENIHWVIVGGESGKKRRPIEADWVRGIQRQCQDSDVAFFFKQWGGLTPKAGGRKLDGVEWSEFPQPKQLELLK